MNTHPRDIDGIVARRFVLSGRVQGVGFRPFVYRTALSFSLRGWVRNEAGRVVIHAEGRLPDLEQLMRALTDSAPPLARPNLEVTEDTKFEGCADFRILASDETGTADVHVPPDLFCCDDCLAELNDPSERRYRYPFTNCTQCGPRYTLIERLPYDRPNTSMAKFALCAACQAEYENPRDRRFHAQPLACSDCGPGLTLKRPGHLSCEGERTLAEAVTCLRDGGIVAAKGVGGYHLLCDAADSDAVGRLRERKHRPHKPLAVMFPQAGADGLAAVRQHVHLTAEEARAGTDPVRPIVLVRKRADSCLSPALAPGLGELGVFLPYSPLHHLLLAEFGAPLVATSGNVSGEPVLTDALEAERRLAGVADSFLHHNRPILRPADDSVARAIGGVVRPIRTGRGMAPLEFELPHALREPTLAVGGHMKATVALGWGRRAVLSPHIGDLDSPRSFEVFEHVIADLQSLYRVTARRIVCDSHPGYASRRWAQRQDLPMISVQHHSAHASVLAGEYPDIARWLVFAWDGVGLGSDGDLWGGEALVGKPGAWCRVASMRTFDPVGGDAVGREPWRSAAALMWEIGQVWTLPHADGQLAAQAWRKKIGTRRTSSVGRLFDAAAALVLGIDIASYEGQGPMMLESNAVAGTTGIDLPLARDEGGLWRTDWAPLLPLLCDATLQPQVRASIFHESLALAAVAQAVALSDTVHFNAVGLTGGVFQNRFLAERVIELLAARGVRAYLPQVVPANDGGIAFGQLVEVLGRDANPTAAASEPAS